MENEIGAKLKQLRQDNHYNQMQVANYLGITQSNLSKIENGQRNLNMTLFKKICLLYNCSSEYLLGESDSYEMPKIAFRCDKNANLEVVAKMNEVMEFLKLLRELDREE